MANFYKSIISAAVALVSVAAVAPAANALPLAKESHGPLRFMPLRNQGVEHLYSVPRALPQRKAPFKSSSSSRVELVANSLTSKVGYGMISFDAVAPLTINKLATTQPLFGGAVYVNGKFYGADYDSDATGALTYNRWYVYDATTWHLEKVVDNPTDDLTYIATDRTYDPVTGTVYSVSYDKTGQSIWLATTSLDDGKSTLIAPLEKNVIMIASDAQGQLYGIDVNANLYKVGKTDAALTLIGNLNVADDYESTLISSCTIDYTTGKMYWAEFSALDWFTSRTTIYEVDTRNCTAHAIGELAGGPELAGLYVADYIQDGVPQAVTDLVISPKETGSQSVAFSFKAPTTDVDGKAIDTAIDIEVSVDNELLDIAFVNPGETYTTDHFDLSRGLHTLKVVGSNEKGQGVVMARMFYAGWDVPAAVKNLNLRVNGDDATLTWGAPSEGSEGGAVRKPFTYNVKRYPGGTLVATGLTATKYSESVSSAALYQYEVIPVSQDGEGVSALSAKAVIGHYSVPYVNSFDTEADFELFTIVDKGSNGRVWNYDDSRLCLRHPWSIDNDIDDYAVSPAITLEAAKSYTVSFDAWQMVGNYEEHVMLYYGTTNDVSKMTLILDTGQLPEEAKNYSAVVPGLADGVHYFALRSLTGKGGFMSYADNFKVVEKGVSSVPAPVGGLTATAAPAGELKVTLNFTAPSTSLNGEALASLTAIEVYRGESAQALTTIDNPEPGIPLTFVDTPAKDGKYTYTLVAYSQSGASEPASVSVYAGTDVPGAPSEVAVELQGLTPVISWTAPAVGANGGNLSGLLSYRVERVYNGQSTIVAPSIKETTFADEPLDNQQAYVYYNVTALTSAGESSAVASNGLNVGEAYTLPFVESFPDGAPACNPWSVEMVVGVQGSWQIGTPSWSTNIGYYPSAKPQDNDGGMATFDGYHQWASGSEIRLISPAIDLSAFRDPTLKFFFYHYNGVDSWSGESEPVNETLEVEISIDGAPFVKLTDEPLTLYAARNGWTEHSFALDQYANCKNARIAFRGKAAGCFNVHIDNISIDGTVAVENIEVSTAKVVGAEGAVVFAGLDDALEVYNAAGQLVARSAAPEGSLSLMPGIYVARSGRSVYKVRVK